MTKPEPFTRTMTVGTIDTGHKTRATVVARVEYDAAGGVSFTANAKRPRARDIDQGGQMQDTIRNIPIEDLYVLPSERDKLVSLWDRWHLNHRRAGCEHQRAEGWADRPIDPEKPTNTYGRHFEGQREDSWNMLAWVRPDEHPDGLLTAPCPTCGYRYGTAWLHEEIPPEVVAEILTLFQIVTPPRRD